jgi:RimJ/RimL family protein N-acetyltransferase
MEIERKNLLFRRISYLDFYEFKKAGIESISTNEAFLSFGPIFKNMTVLEYMYLFSDLMKDESIDSYGLFHNRVLLGYLSFSFGFSDLGTELIGWTRNGFHQLGLGELGLNTACEVAFQSKNFNYVELKIDATNTNSRKLAEKCGFNPYLKIKYNIGSEDCYIYYVKFNPKIIALAKRYGLRPIDVANSPASAPSLNYFLKSPRVIEFYEWPFEHFDDNRKAINSTLLVSFLATINFRPEDINQEVNGSKAD